MDGALTKTETKQLAKSESLIQAGLTTFFAVGQALWDIRDGKLYRESHETFERYCEDRWDFTRQRAYQLITAAETAADLSTAGVTELERETHVRPLLAIPAADRAAVAAEAVATAPTDSDGKPRITAKHVEETVEKWKARQAKAAEISAPKPDVIDVESRPVEEDEDQEDEFDDDDYEEELVSDRPPVVPPECPNCHCTEWAEDDEGYFCRNCKETLGDKEQDPEREKSRDDLVLESMEDAIREQFDGRLNVAAARLEHMVDRLRADA